MTASVWWVYPLRDEACQSLDLVQSGSRPLQIGLPR